MERTRRWLQAVALPLVLAACTSSGSGPGADGGIAGAGDAAVGGLRTIRHVWFIDLENQGYAQTWRAPASRITTA